MFTHSIVQTPPHHIPEPGDYVRDQGDYYLVLEAGPIRSYPSAAADRLATLQRLEGLSLGAAFISGTVPCRVAALGTVA